MSSLESQLTETMAEKGPGWPYISSDTAGVGGGGWMVEEDGIHRVGGGTNQGSGLFVLFLTLMDLYT